MATDNTFLAAATAAATSDELLLDSGDVARISASGLGYAESIQLEAYQGSAFYPVISGTPLVLTASDPVMIVHGPGQYRLNKPVTAAAVALYVDQ